MSSVDVVVPCYNYGRYLRACVGSILSQRDVDVRVLIIDDKSSDDSAEIGMALAASDPRVTYRRHEVNRGLIGTANEGIDWVTATYWLLLSADDALTPGALSRAATVLDAHPGVGMVYGIAEIVGGEAGLPDLPDPGAPTFRIISGSDFLQRSCEHGNPVPSPCAVVRTSLQKELGGYCPHLPHTSDLEMWMRIATRASIGVVHELQGFYRWHRANMSADFYGQPVSDRRERILTCREVLEKWGSGHPDLGKWVTKMEHALAREALILASFAYERDDDDRRWREMMAFAAEHDPAMWRSVVYWKFQLKRLVGREVARRIRGSGTLWSDDKNLWHMQAHQVGWWPDVD